MTKNFFTALGVISIGLLMALIILNTASGCGTEFGSCIILEDFSNG